MKKKVTLTAVALCLLMLFAAAAPVMAYDPKPCFTIGEVYVPNPTAPPPTVILTKSGEFVLGLYGIDYGYSIFGYQVFNEEDWFYESNTLTGYGIDTIISSSISPFFEEHDVLTINGPGHYTYTGPAFTYSGSTYYEWISGVTRITTGESFYGLLLTGTGSIHWTSGPLAGETTVDTWAGVILSDGSGIFGVTVYVH